MRLLAANKKNQKKGENRYNNVSPRRQQNNMRPASFGTSGGRTAFAAERRRLQEILIGS